MYLAEPKPTPGRDRRPLSFYASGAKTALRRPHCRWCTRDCDLSCSLLSDGPFGIAARTSVPEGGAILEHAIPLVIAQGAGVRGDARRTSIHTIAQSRTLSGPHPREELRAFTGPRYLPSSPSSLDAARLVVVGASSIRDHPTTPRAPFRPRKPPIRRDGRPRGSNGEDIRPSPFAAPPLARDLSRRQPKLAGAFPFGRDAGAAS